MFDKNELWMFDKIELWMFDKNELKNVLQMHVHVLLSNNVFTSTMDFLKIYKSIIFRKKANYKD